MSFARATGRRARSTCGRLLKASQASATFFEKKVAKKLLVLRAGASAVPSPAGQKVFWFFFSKKNLFLFRIAGWLCHPAFY
jgi:hypothetical protein